MGLPTKSYKFGGILIWSVFLVIAGKSASGETSDG